MDDVRSFNDAVFVALSLVAEGLKPVASRAGAAPHDGAALDATVLLSAVLAPTTQGSLSRPARSLAHEVRRLRNLWAHGHPFDLEAKVRFLGSCWRLLDEIDAHEAEDARRVLDRWLGANVAERSTPGGSGPVPLPPPTPPGTLGEQPEQPPSTCRDGRDPLQNTPVPPASPADQHTIQNFLLHEYGLRLDVPEPYRGEDWVPQGESPAPCPSCGSQLEVFRRGRFDRLPDFRPMAVFCLNCLRFQWLSALPEATQSILIGWGEFGRPASEARLVDVHDTRFGQTRS